VRLSFSFGFRMMAAVAFLGSSGFSAFGACSTPAVAIATPGGTLPVASAKLRAGGPILVLAIGSSTTAGVGSGGAGYAQLLGPLLSARSGKTVRVIVSGSSGETASGAAARLSGEIAMHKPDLVVWQVGTNDANFGVGAASFRQTLSAGLASIKNAGVDAVLVDPQFSNWAERGGSATDAIAAVVAEEGQRRGVPVARRFQAMKRLAATDRPAFDRLISWDGLHLSPEGHACMAEQVAGTILRTVAR